KHPKALELVARMSDEDIWRLNRGGHDPHKVYAAYAAATKHKGQPTVILAKTIKGYGLGKQGQAKNPTHQLKKMDLATIREMRDRFNVPIPDDKLEELPLYKPKDDDPIMVYLHERRQHAHERHGGRDLAPFRAFQLLIERRKSRHRGNVGRHIVPIVPDEA